MMTHAEVESMVMALPGVYCDYPFGEGVAVYFVDDRRSTMDDGKPQNETDDVIILTSNVQRPTSKPKMFALIDEKSMPVRLSLKCDPGLAELLRDTYETVLPGYHLNKKHWNTIICSGQVPDDELRDLVRHSYELVRPRATE